MKFKLFNLKHKNCKQLIIGYSRDDEAKDFLFITGYWEDPNGEEWYMYDEIRNDNKALLDRILIDFSESSAIDYIDGYKF